MNRVTFKNCYSKRYNDLKIISEILLADLKKRLDQYPRIYRITTRPKSIDRFVSKANKKKNNTYKYSDPLNDQIGARIITIRYAPNPTTPISVNNAI